MFSYWRGIYFRNLFRFLSFFLFLFFSLLASWLLGCLASWLLGFLAFRLLGFSASGLLGFSAFCWFMRLLVAFWLFASSAFPVPLRQVAFWLCGFSLVYVAFGSFWRLWLFASFGFFWLLCPFIGFWIWLPASSASPPPYLNHHFFRSRGGGEPPPQPTRYCLDCNCTPFESTLLQASWGGVAASPPLLLDFLQRLNCTPV